MDRSGLAAATGELPKDQSGYGLRGFDRIAFPAAVAPRRVDANLADALVDPLPTMDRGVAGVTSIRCVGDT